MKPPRIVHRFVTNLSSLLASCSLLVVTAFGAAWAADDQPPAPVYSVKEPHDLTRTRIRSTVVNGSAVPLNLRYEQLSDEHKAQVRSQYEALAADDEPPFPAEGLKPLYQALYQVQQQLLVRGDLTLVASVLPDGTVDQVQAIGAQDPDMVNAAARVLMATAFKPALCHGQPCRMDYPVRLHFAVR